MNDLSALVRVLELRQIAFENVIREHDPKLFEEYQKELRRQIELLVEEFPSLADAVRGHLKNLHS